MNFVGERRVRRERRGGQAEADGHHRPLPPRVLLLPHHLHLSLQGRRIPLQLPSQMIPEQVMPKLLRIPRAINVILSTPYCGSPIYLVYVITIIII